MKITKDMIDYCLDLHHKVRFAKRTFMFSKPIEEQVEPEFYKGVEDYYDIGHVQGFFSTKKGIRYVFFLGSNEILDWFYNFWFRFSETPYKSKNTSSEIKVHSGFYSSYLKVRDIIRWHVRDQKKILITGHSLGGAMATLAAVDMQYNYPDKEIACFTTGAPRVGNRAFVASFNKRVHNTLRYVNGNDIVPSVPPSAFGFRHVSERVGIGDRRKHGLSFADHSINRYIENLKSTTND